MMLKKKLLLVKVVFGLCMAFSPTTNAMERAAEISAVLIDSHNQPSPELKNLLALFDLPSNDLKTIVEVTQRSWLRPAGKERWELDEIAPEKTEQLKAIFAKLGLVQEIKPAAQKYEYALLMGARLASTQKRVNYLLNLWQQGIRFNSIVVLTGERPLDPAIEAIEMANGSKATTECTMSQAVFAHLKAPEAFKNIPVTFVSVPMITAPDGKVRRPTTGDTVKEWLQANPVPGNCLVLSNQPFVGYQDSVVKTLLPKSFAIESAGCGADNTHNAEVLDTLARWLYQEKIRRYS
jgi:hypothetical protein